jgi:sugar phosphate isomerase/epimerase
VVRRLALRAVPLAILLTCIVAAASTMAGEAADEPSKTAGPANVLACRLANYKQFQEAAWEHLPSIGFQYVFIRVMPPDQIEATKRRLAQHGLKVAVIRGDTDLGRESSVDELAVQLETCEKLGVKYMFLSPKHTGVSQEVACARLRQAGDLARKHGVTIALETHPDLGTNGDVHVETMRAINHPNIRVNFDTGNVTYYNHDTDAATELAKCVDYVATVEFKDHNGEYETWNFPTIGTGVVDFPAVVKILKDHHYTGPITMEVEGVHGVETDEAEIKRYIEQSAAYVRSLGRFE